MNWFLEGKSQARQRDRRTAIAAFKEAIDIEPEFKQAHYELAISQLLEKEYKNALASLEKAEPQTLQQINPYYLAEIYFFNMKYEEAEQYYSSYLTSGAGHKNLKRIAKINLNKAQFAKEAINQPLDFVPKNLGNKINSSGDDYLPFLTADDKTLIFTSRRAEGTGGYNPRLRDYDEDFYSASLEKGKWVRATNLGEPINTPANEGAASISQDGKLIFFTACNRPESVGSCDIFYSIKQGKDWSAPKNMGPRVNSPAWDSQPCLSHDGKTLFFSSTRPGGKGGRDIWYTELSGGKWSEARNLSSIVNSPGNESSPFIHADNKTLYFSSDFHPGFGSVDLFLSHRTEDGWSIPKNLGYPLNTLAEEANIFVNASGDIGFINSYREGGYGRSDIYTFSLDPTIRPQRATYLKGKVIDSLSREPLRARIRLIDIESGDTIRTIMSDRISGEFLMSLPLDHEYAAFAEAPKYLFSSKNFYLKEIEEDIYFELIIPLMPIKEGAEVILKNIFFESGSYALKESSNTELSQLYKYLRQNPDIQIEIQGHTDDVGTDEDNLILSQNRAEAVRTYLLNKGIVETRIIANGYGENEPIVPNDSDEHRAQNRRTTFKILKL